MKKKTFIIVIITVIGIYSIVSLLSMFNEVSKTGFSEEPEDFKSLITEKTEFNIEYIITATYNDKYPFSGYIVKNCKCVFTILRLPTNSKNVLSQIKFSSDKKSGKSMNKKITLLGNSFNLSRSDIKSIDELSIYIENYKTSYIKLQNDSIMYMTFMLDRNFAIDFNNSKYIDIHLGINSSEDLEENELMILNKKVYLYFIYSRHPSKKVYRNKILEKIISF